MGRIVFDLIGGVHLPGRLVFPGVQDLRFLVKSDYLPLGVKTPKQNEVRLVFQKMGVNPIGFGWQRQGLDNQDVKVSSHEIHWDLLLQFGTPTANNFPNRLIIQVRGIFHSIYHNFPGLVTH